MMRKNDALQEIEADIKDYLLSLDKERQLSIHTVKSYQRDLGKLQRFIEQQDVDSGLSLSPAVARQFPARLHAGGLGGKSIQRALSAVRGFYKFLINILYVVLFQHVY